MHPQSNQFVRCSAAWSSVWEQGGMHILGGFTSGMGIWCLKKKKKSLPYQILALWHQLREAFYLSAYKMTSFITLLYLVIFWWLLFEIEKKKKRARERLCICPIPALLQVAKQSINQNLAFTNSLSKALLLPSSTADIVEYLQVCSFMHMARGPWIS